MKSKSVTSKISPFANSVVTTVQWRARKVGVRNTKMYEQNWKKAEGWSDLHGEIRKTSKRRRRNAEKRQHFLFKHNKIGQEPSAEQLLQLYGLVLIAKGRHGEEPSEWRGSKTGGNDGLVLPRPRK